MQVAPLRAVVDGSPGPHRGDRARCRRGSTDRTGMHWQRAQCLRACPLCGPSTTRQPLPILRRGAMGGTTRSPAWWAPNAPDLHATTSGLRGPAGAVSKHLMLTDTRGSCIIVSLLVKRRSGLRVRAETYRPSPGTEAMPMERGPSCCQKARSSPALGDRVRVEVGWRGRRNRQPWRRRSDDRE